jgi:hypothetical protein
MPKGCPQAGEETFEPDCPDDDDQNVAEKKEAQKPIGAA